MANRKLLLIGLLIVFAVLGFLFYPRDPNSKPADFHRVIVDRNFSKSKRIDTYRIVMSLSEFGPSLFMNRMFDVVRMSPDGDILDTFQIKDPHYLSSNFLVGFDADSLGVYFQDTENRTFTKMTYDRRISYQKKINSPLLRSVYLGNNSFLIKTMGMADNYANDFFEIYHPEDSSRSVMDSLIPRYGKGGLASDGLFIRNGDGLIFYFYYYMSHIFVFDKNGKPLPGFNTIDGDNTPPIVIRTSSGYTRSPEARALHSAAYADSQYLYIASYVRSVDISQKIFDNNYVIDVYDIRGGRYKNSFLIPKSHGNHLSSIFMKNDRFYAVEKNRILTIYK